MNKFTKDSPDADAYLQKKAKNKCRDGKDHTFVLPPITDLSFKAMCCICDLEVIGYLTETMGVPLVGGSYP